MELKTILEHLEHHLSWLGKQNIKYLNVASLAPEEHDFLKCSIQSIFGNRAVENNDKNSNSPIQENKSILNQPLESNNSNNKKGVGPTSSTFSADIKEVSQQEFPSEINSLESLYYKYSACHRCILGSTRRNFVFGAGNEKARLMFVGEAPGADEDFQGYPFVGKAGQLLTRMIHTIGIDRLDVYISNIIKCRPPNNRNPLAEEIARCFPILQKQIELINPRLIVTIGNVPTQTLIPGLPGITRTRGKLYQYQKWDVLPTFHPAYLLRNPGAMELSWDDFKKIQSICFNNQ